VTPLTPARRSHAYHAPMEFLLRWWDEFDDAIDTSRQLMGYAVDELSALAAPLATACLSLLLALLRAA
jgi:hypothetical protein